MLLDLVSPWTAAVSSSDPTSLHAFQAEHGPLLAEVQRQRTAADAPMRSVRDASLLRSLTLLASGRIAQQRMLHVVERAASLGADVPSTVVLVAGDGRGDPIEVLPWRAPAIVAVFVELMGGGQQGVRRLHSAIARGLALNTRWGAATSESPLAIRRRPWDRWEKARDVPLSEWLYSDGVASHLTSAVMPDMPVHLVLGVTAAQFTSLRQQERALRQRLAPDLHEPGVGGVLRWLPQGTSRARSGSADVVPSGAGRYLAWRMTADRVQAIGFAAALRVAS